MISPQTCDMVGTKPSLSRRSGTTPKALTSAARCPSEIVRGVGAALSVRR
jgi:hypothetical protein